MEFERLCGHWKILVQTNKYQRLTYTAAQAACRSNKGYFLPSETLWNSVLKEMKVSTDLECRKLAANFDKISLWYARHWKEADEAHRSSVCVGK